MPGEVARLAYLDARTSSYLIGNVASELLQIRHFGGKQDTETAASAS
jgi:hypothetical protein